MVLKLVEGLENRRHVVAMNKKLTSIELLKTLVEKGVYGTDIIRANRIGFPKAISDTKKFAKNPQGTLD